MDWLDILAKEGNRNVIDMIIGGVKNYFGHIPHNPLPLCRDVATARYLLEHGANPDYKGPDGLSLLHRSVINKDDKMIALLNEFGITLSQREGELLAARQLS
jgi:ankyrin repeat protein